VQADDRRPLGVLEVARNCFPHRFTQLRHVVRLCEDGCRQRAGDVAALRSFFDDEDDLVHELPSSIRYAALRPRGRETEIRMRAPACPSMLTSVSIVNKSIRPRVKWLTRG
jgi:hypothetical protein